MKRIIPYIICFTLLFSNCNNEEFLQDAEESLPIRFSSQCINISTRTTGTISGNLLPSATQVSLFSLQHPANTPPAKWLPELFNNTIGIADSQGDILYDNTYYFPVGEELDFFSIHPSINEMGSVYSDAKTIDIQLKEDVTEQFDLMYASLLNQSKKTPTLVLKFNHLLSQITFHMIQGASAIIDLPLTKIEIQAPKTGTLNLWTGELDTFTDQSSIYTLNTHTVITDETPVDGQFMLFPEKATDIFLTFGTDGSQVYHLTLATSEEPYRWESGKNYQYNITINKNITDQISPAPDNSNTTDTEVTEPSVPTDTPDKNTNNDIPDSNSPSSTEELPTNEEESPSLPKDTCTIDTNNPSSNPDATLETSRLQTKTGMPQQPGVVIINLSLD